MKFHKNISTITYMKRKDRQNLKAFGQVVRKIRERSSRSLNDTALCKNGVTPATLSRIENGLVDFKFLTLLNLAYTLDVSLVELFENYKYQMNRDE